MLGLRDTEVPGGQRVLGKKDGGCPATLFPSGRPFSPKDLLNKAVSNVIASLTFGFRFSTTILRIIKLLDLMDDMLKGSLA